MILFFIFMLMLFRPIRSYVMPSRRLVRFRATARAVPREGVGLPKGYSDPNKRYILDGNQGAQSRLPDLNGPPFLVLGIETSCDDTGVAVVSSDGNILSNVVKSQHEIHEQYGGIFPSLAMKAHKRNIDAAVQEAIQQAGLQSIRDVQAISFTKGPGLEICLRIGCRKAQELAREFNLPLVATHHLESHCLVARLAGRRIVPTGDPQEPYSAVEVQQPQEHPVVSRTLNRDRGSGSEGVHLPHFTPKVEYPFLTLLASGGHTSLLICRAMGVYDVLGGTLDDALGESFDKCARLVGLRAGGAGGAAVEAIAKGGDPTKYTLKVPMQAKPTCDFSYAGLKNQFRITVSKARADEGLSVEGTNAPAQQGEKAPEPVVLPKHVQADLCASFQHTAFAHVEDRLHRAMDYMDEEGIDVSALVVVGGVAANQELRQRLLALLERRAQRREKLGTAPREMSLIFPPLELCTDNGVMPAWAGIEKLHMGLSDDVDDQEVVARWPLGLPILGEDGMKRVFKKQKF